MKNFPQAFVLSFLMAFATSVFGQEPPEQGPPPDRPADRMSILRDLGLSQDQFRQMRLINQDIRAKRQEARLRVGEATRNLDQAIYADTVDESIVSQRLRDLQEAQAEVVKVNFENEFAIRKVLNPEQLVRFRDIRDRFNKAREEFQKQRQNRIENRSGPRPSSGQQRVRPPANQPVNNSRPVERKRSL